MSEIILIEILISAGVIFLISYIIYFHMHKNQKHQRMNQKEMELIREEKELDRTEIIKRDLYIFEQNEAKRGVE